MGRIYVAGPLFNTHERWYLERIAEALEGAGYATFLPHRDAGLIDLQDPASQVKVFRDDIAALDACDLCVALLTGPDQDSGTSAELGYMFAQGKPCFGISDDFRYRNNMLWGICGEGARLAKDIPGLMALLEAWEWGRGPEVGYISAPGEPLRAEAEAILLRGAERSGEGLTPAATFERVAWTIDELLEEAEDPDYAAGGTARARELRIVRDLLALLRPLS